MAKKSKKKINGELGKPRAEELNVALMGKKCGGHEAKAGKKVKRAKAKNQFRKELKAQSGLFYWIKDIPQIIKPNNGKRKRALWALFLSNASF